MKHLAALLLFTTVIHAQDLPTLMTTRGKLMVDQKFEKDLPPFDGKSNGFASGFNGRWRFNTEKRGGHWIVKDGAFTGSEFTDPSIKHPATASYGFDFKNVIIQCDVRMNDVPMEGRAGRRIAVRTTDTKDYVCGLSVSPTGWAIEKCDNDHAGPDKAVPLGEVKAPMKLNEWHSVVFEILGEEIAVTVDGKTLTGTHSLIGKDKCSIMFVSGVDSSVRNFRVWEAKPNPEWSANKAKLTQK